ncbi:MAG: urease accessory protein UreE [Acidimicrobiia bacterium]
MDGPDQIVCTAIVGHVDDPTIAVRLVELGHHHIETVVVPAGDAARRRLRLRGDRGSEILIALDRSQQLRDGAVLDLGSDRAVIVRLAESSSLGLRPRDSAAALRLGHRAGSLHWAVSFDPSGSMQVLDARPDDVQARLADLFEDGSVRWD